MSEKIFLLSAALGLCLATALAHASDRSMRCGRNLIHAGGIKDSAGMYEVLKKCGEPEAKMGNSWVYVQGRVRRTLTFGPEGKLQRIESDRN